MFPSYCQADASFACSIFSVAFIVFDTVSHIVQPLMFKQAKNKQAVSWFIVRVKIGKPIHNTLRPETSYKIYRFEMGCEIVFYLKIKIGNCMDVFFFNVV